MKWNDDWREELKTDNYSVWERLAECRNTKRDIILMAKLNYKYNPSRSKKDCLDRILEWVTAWNSQDYLYPDDKEEYDEMLKKL